MKHRSRPFEQDSAVGPPIEFFPKAGRVRMRNRRTGEILDGNSGGQAGVMGQVYAGDALKFSLLNGWKGADLAEDPWDAWIEPLGYDARSNMGMSFEPTGPPVGPWMVPGHGRLCFRTRANGKVHVLTGVLPNEQLWPRLLHLWKLTDRLVEMGSCDRDVWIEAEVIWTQPDVIDDSFVMGYAVGYDRLAGWKELGGPVEPLAFYREFKGAARHMFLSYAGIEVNGKKMVEDDPHPDHTEDGDDPDSSPGTPPAESPS